MSENTNDQPTTESREEKRVEITETAPVQTEPEKVTETETETSTTVTEPVQPDSDS